MRTLQEDTVRTLEETAAHFGLSIDVVRRIEQVAFRKLRHNPAIQELFKMVYGRLPPDIQTAGDMQLENADTRDVTHVYRKLEEGAIYQS